MWVLFSNTIEQFPHKTGVKFSDTLPALLDDMKINDWHVCIRMCAYAYVYVRTHAFLYSSHCFPMPIYFPIVVVLYRTYKYDGDVLCIMSLYFILLRMRVCVLCLMSSMKISLSTIKFICLNRPSRDMMISGYSAFQHKIFLVEN